MRTRTFGNYFLIIMLIGGNAYAQTQLPKCVLFGFGNCIGTLRFSNGDTYTGEFNYGKPNGKGAFTYGNGDSYSGTVLEGQRHGSGTYASATGDKYVGQFSEGKFEGVGTYFFLANNRSKGDVYAGEFSSNTFNGHGRYTHANGQVFVGSFINGRKSVPIVAPETLLAQAEVQRLAEENAKQKEQLESQLEAERRERLAREKLAAAALVAQAEAQRIAEENAKQKEQLESQLEAERSERLAREKQAAAALPAKQDVQVVPITSPASAAVVAATVDKAAPQPETVVTKVQPVPAYVETAQQLYGSQDSVVQAPQAAKSRAEELFTATSERSKWYVTGGVIQSNIPTFVTCYLSCTKTTNPYGLSMGAGYQIFEGFAVEALAASLGSETVSWSSAKAEAKIDWSALMLEGIFSWGIYPKTQINIGAGYYKAFIDASSSWSSGSSIYHYQADDMFLSLGGAYKLNSSTALRLKWIGFQTKQASIGEKPEYQGFDLGIKYNF